MLSFPFLNGNIIIPANKNIPTTAITTTQLVPTTHLVPTFPSTYVLNAVTPSVIYDTSLLARPVFRQEVPLFGFTPYQSIQLDSNHRIEQDEIVNLETKSSKKRHKTKEIESDKCCCCCNCGNNSKLIETDHEIKEKLNQNETCKEEQETNIVFNTNKIECSTNDSVQQPVEENHECKHDSFDLKMRNMSLDEKIKLIREELNLANRDQELLKENPICFCKPDPVVTDEPAMIPNEKTKYMITYSRSKSENTSNNTTNTTHYTNSILPLRPKSRTKSPKPWIPTGRNEYNRLHFNDYSNDITKVQHLGGVNNNSNNTNTNTTTNNSNLVETTQTNETPVKYYAITTKTPAKTIIRTTIDSRTFLPSVKTKETYSSVNLAPNSVNMSQWSSQNYY